VSAFEADLLTVRLPPSPLRGFGGQESRTLRQT